MSFSGPKINWLTEGPGELDRTLCAYVETGVSPSIGSWSRTVNVARGFPARELFYDETLRSAIYEVEEDCPRFR